MFIIVEGLDKVGKGTIETELLKRLNYKPIILDRGPAGYDVFNKIFNRNKDETYEKEFNLIKKSGLFSIIYLYCDTNDFYKRMNENNERILYDYDKYEKLYRETVLNKYDNVLLINTSQMSKDKIVDMIVERL